MAGRQDSGHPTRRYALPARSAAGDTTPNHPKVSAPRTAVITTARQACDRVPVHRKMRHVRSPSIQRMDTGFMPRIGRVRSAARIRRPRIPYFDISIFRYFGISIFRE